MRLLAKALMLAALLLPASIVHPGDTNILCLAKNIYHEARGESRKGKLAVAKVTLNRAAHPKFAKTICGVVYQPKQFSWTLNYKPKEYSGPEWEDSLALAREAFATNLVHFDFPALYFHSASIKPKWKRKRLAQIGNQIFYL